VNKQRLEAFTDGVYAIVITLLILDIRIPEVPPDSLGPALLRILPQVFTYVLSFFIIGLYWFSHHRIAQQVKQIDGTFIWLNMIWLLFVNDYAISYCPSWTLPFSANTNCDLWDRPDSSKRNRVYHPMVHEESPGTMFQHS
jgi:hypothetical protein